MPSPPSSPEVQPRPTFDDDALSVISYDDKPVLNPIQRRVRRHTGRLVGPVEPIRVDGRVPDVIHKLEYIGELNHLRAVKQSVHAFKNIHDIKGFTNDDDASDNESRPEIIERPVIEIVTKIYTREAQRPRFRRRHPGPRRRKVVDRPLTSSFDPDESDFYQYDSDSDSGESDVDLGDEVSSPVMWVHSEHLKNAIKAVVSYYPRAKLTGKPLTLPAPFRILYHHRQELAEYRDNQPSAHSPEYAALTAKHIDVLLKFLDESLSGKEIRREEELHKLETPMATHDYFWLLLKPGQVVYAKRRDIWTPFVVSSVIGGGDPYDSSSSFGDRYKITAWNLESNGTKVNRYMESLSLAPWHGEAAISSLSVIPAAFWKEDLEAQGGLTMREKCIAEGRHYWDLLKAPTYMEYDGLLINSWGKSQTSGLTGFMTGRVICDASGFSKYVHQAPEFYDRPYRGSNRRQRLPSPPSKDHLPQTSPHCSCEVCDEDRASKGNGGNWANSDWYGFEDLDPLVDSPPPKNDDLFFMLLSSIIPGFILNRRRWGFLNVAHLKPVKTDKDAFRYLVLEDDVKLTVKALIGKFQKGGESDIVPWGGDFVKNKGEGRIFLLHGTPGVGKTCTAECIAELTNRPLISLTSGDLGADGPWVEHHLNYFFDLGQRYGALVLLDEADVYLERRRTKDLHRNCLVSIFLRALEYYRGLLIITTNRVESFDGAFLSRIHVALHYRNLGDEERERIWAHNFERLGRDSAGKVHVSTAAREFLWNSPDVRSLQWNGREIRNAMQTALALAEDEADEEGAETITITEKHVRAVVKLSRGFRDFVTLTGEAPKLIKEQE